MKKTFKIARTNSNGRIASLKKAKLNPDLYNIESMPKAGFGDTK